MGKGYGEGPAAEELFEALERGESLAGPEPSVERRAVYGSTLDNSEKHFIGWLDDVDPDRLFTTGKAWGISIVRRTAK